MTDNELKESIKKEEDLRLDVYKDSLGNLTVGWGHLIREGTTIPKEAADIIFEHDFETAATDYLKLGLELDPGRRAAIVDMLFQMGLGGVKKFKKMLEHLKNKNWIQAAYELMNSEYANQTPNRAKRNRDRILRGY